MTGNECTKDEIPQDTRGNRKSVIATEQETQKIADHMGLVYMVAGRFRDRGLEQEELIQIGSVGLVKAVRQFDETRGYAFSTYAVPLIMGEIRRYLRDDGMIHVSRGIKEHVRMIADGRSSFLEREQREPSIFELEEETGLSREEIVLATNAARPIESIHRSISEDGEVTIEDMVVDTKQSRFEGHLLDRLSLAKAVGNLSETEQKLIGFRYGQELSQTRTAELLNMNQVAVSRMERKVLQKLRGELRV